MIEEELIIVGSGPAAYTAALYSMRHKPLMLEGGMVGSNGPGGQLTTTTNVDNYPGFPSGIQGPELMKKMKMQALENGLRIKTETAIWVSRCLPNSHRSIAELGMNSFDKEAQCDFESTRSTIFVSTDTSTYKCTSLIIATGAISRRLFVPGTGDNEFWQRGISSCAVCDGFFFMNKVVCVIGGGDTAMEEALYLSSIASKVILIHRRKEFRARKDKLEMVKRAKNVSIMTPYILTSAHGEEVLSSVKLQNQDDMSVTTLAVDGLFFGIGHDPNTKFLCKEEVKCDEGGYVVCKEDGSTSSPGIYACGDVTDKKYRQAVTAAASGCIAGISASKHLDRLNIA